MIFPPAISRKKEIAQIVSEAEAELRPKVERIRWDIGQDWTGDWAIFLRVVLSDAVVRKRNWFKIASQAEARILEKLPTDELGVIPYVHFRSQAETVEMPEKAWS
jgi:hypothetical protein